MHRLTRKEMTVAAGLLLAATGALAQSAPPQEVESLLRQGAAAMQAGKTDEALKEIDVALNELPGEVECYIPLVRELTRSGRQKEADELFQRGLRFDRVFGYNISQDGMTPFC